MLGVNALNDFLQTLAEPLRGLCARIVGRRLQQPRLDPAHSSLMEQDVCARSWLARRRIPLQGPEAALGVEGVEDIEVMEIGDLVAAGAAQETMSALAFVVLLLNRLKTI